MRPFRKYILLFFLSGVILLPSCKSRKTASSTAAKTERKKIAQLSKQLNVSINEQSNVALYELIHDWIGVPHKDNGCSKSGTDCSCFIKMVLAEVYRKDVGRSSHEMFTRSQRIESKDLQEGDLVFFKIKSVKVSHVGLYLNENKFVHVSSSKGVMISGLDEAYFKNSFVGAGRIN